MAVNKNFVVKNGLEVAENLIFADSDKVGIGSTAPLAKLDVKGNINATDVFSSGVTTVATAFNVGTGGTIIAGTTNGLVGFGTAVPAFIVDIKSPVSTGQTTLNVFGDTVISGDIKIDNQSIYSRRLSSLRDNISLVSQETTLFDDTVLNNIKYANLDATDEQIKEAAKLSRSEEFIEMLPKKYNTLIGENGIRLSGGEKQRLSIARAILKKSKIILLDEATSSLDAETEQKIQDAINYLTKGRTTLVIAHRLSTILNSKDFVKAKETFKFIKSKKWNSAMKTAEKVKDRDFRTLVKWMYLKTTGNSATFNDYKKFIERNYELRSILR